MFEEEIALAQVKDFFVNTWNTIYTFFASYQWEEFLFNVRLAFILLSVILLFLIIFLLIKISVVSPLYKSLKGTTHKAPDPVLSKKKIQKRWTKIEARAKSGLEANYKLAILEADKLFDRVLKNVGYEMGKKLKSMEEIKLAGKIKDKIIEDKYKPSREEAEKSVDAYKRGLEELEML